MRCLTLAVLILIHLAGCATRTVSNSPRTAIEQMLLSTAIDTALEKFELPQAKGKKSTSTLQISPVLTLNI